MSEPNVTPAAEVAHAMSECMNLLFLFAAPRVYATYQWSSPTPLGPETAEACLSRFVETVDGIRARGQADAEELGRVAEVAGICEDMRRKLSATRMDDALPDEVVEPARRALAELGFPAPAGGWDAFEGYPVPQPTRSDSH